MGKVIKKKIQGMSWWMKTSLVLLLTLVTTVFMYEGWYKPLQIQAAISAAQSFPNTPTISGTTAASVSGAYTINAGSNRLLVVSVSASFSGTPATQSVAATYGGQTLTQMVVSDVTQRRFVWIGYLKEAQIAAASGSTLQVTLANNTSLQGTETYAAVFTGVDQTTPVNATYSFYNNAVSALLDFGTGLAVNAGGYSLYGVTVNNATAPAISGDTGYTLTTMNQIAAVADYSYTGSKAFAAAGTADPVNTFGATIRGGIAAATLNPAAASGNLSIAAGTNPASANAQQASTNNALNGFQMFMSAGSSTVSTLRLTGSAQFTSANVAAVRLYRDNGTVGLYEAGTDVLVPTTTAWASNVATLTITTPEPVSTATGNYLVVVDLTPTATVGNTLSGTITLATGTGIGTPTYNDSSSATLTVIAGDAFTLNDGTNPANANASISSTNNALDSFAMSDTGTDTINTLTLTGSANFTTANISGIKVYADNGTIGTFDGADVLIPTTYSAITGNATTITFTTPEPVSTTIKNYLVTVDIAGTGTATQTFTGRITAGSGSYVSATYNDTASATLTITPVQTLTVGNGTNPASANISTGGSTALDAFTLALNTGSATINTLTLTGSANFTTANIASAAVYADNGVVGTYEPGTDTLVASTYSQTGTVGTITFTTPPTVTNVAKNYLVVVTATAGATVNQTFTGTITAASGTGIGTPVYGDSGSATLTIVSGPISQISNCGGCHGYPGGTHALTDVASRTNGLFPGSHNQHVNTYSYACNRCHVVPATTTSADFAHQNGRVRMANPINGNTGATYGAYTSLAVSTTPTYYSCSTTVCHGQKSPTWGTLGNANSCLKCHGQLAGTFSNFSAANIAPGAPGQDTGGNTAATSPRVGTHQQHLLAQSKMSPAVHCGECHTVHLTVTDATHLNYTTATLSFGPMATKNATIPPSVARVSGVINCSNVYCHFGSRPAGTAAGQRGAGPFATWAFNGTAILNNTTIAGTCTNKCHGLPPGGGVTGDTHVSLATPTTVAGLSACSSLTGGTGCHPTLKVRPGVTNFTNLTSVFVNNGALHIDGIVEGGSCTGCHASTKGNRVAAAAQFTGAGNSHHFQSTTAIDGKTCYACHWEADATGSPTTWHKNGVSGSPVALVVWNGTTRPTGTPTSATLQYYSSGGAAASTRGAIAKINRVCIGCHNATNAATQPFSAGGDTNTPVKYAWDGLSIDARYSDTGTTPWGKFSGNDTNAKSGQTKAYSAHGNAVNNPMGWSTVADTFPSSKATSNVMCFDCHNSHGSTTASVANAVTSSYSSATGRRKGGILKDVTAGYGGYTITYEPAAGGLAANKNAYNSGAGLCFDCHMTATATTTPWGFTGTFGFALPAGQTAGTGISGYFDTPFFGLGTFASTATYTYKAAHGASVGGHLGASSALTTAITKRTFDPATPTGTVIQGLCTPCHDPHGVSSSLGTNQQYGVPLLKGTWVTSPYKQDAAPANTNEARGGSRGPKSTQAPLAVGSTPVYQLDQRAFQAAATGRPTTAKYWTFATNATTLQTTNDTQFAGLCTGCHAKTVLTSTAAASSTTWKSMTRIHNSVKGWASATGTGGNLNNKVHAYTCSKCHTPHNYRLPRLLVTNCLDVKHRGRVTSGGDMAASNTGSSSSGAGAGRFPGGGGGAAGRSSATNPGPWFFGVSNGTSNTVPAVQACHASATAGGSTYSTASELWNTKSPW